MHFKITKSKIFLIACVAFIAGVALSSFLPPVLARFAPEIFAAAVGFLLAALFLWKNPRARLTFLAGLFLCLGVWRLCVALPADAPDRIRHYNGQTVSFIGLISNEPDVRQNNVQLEVSVQRLTSGRQAVTGKVLVIAGLYPRYRYGDLVEMSCDPEAPTAFDDFAYDRYLARFGIYSTCYYPKAAAVLARGRGNRLLAGIYGVKDGLRGLIDRGLGEPAAGLAQALVLGDKHALSDDLRTIFAKAGVSHITAISGMHISILGAMVMSLLLGIGLPRRRAFYFASAFLALYIVMIGLPASALRAGLMGFLALLALQVGRLNRLRNMLALAAAALLAGNPLLLRDDVGFRLSFLAVLGIVYGYPFINGRLARLKVPRLAGMRDVVALSLAAQIFTVPVIALDFSRLSLVAPLSNLLILWILPFAIAALLAGLVVGACLAALLPLVFFPAQAMLNYIIAATRAVVAIPFASIEVNRIWWGFVIGYYLLIIVILVYAGRRELPARSVKYPP